MKKRLSLAVFVWAIVAALAVCASPALAVENERPWEVDGFAGAAMQFSDGVPGPWSLDGFGGMSMESAEDRDADRMPASHTNGAWTSWTVSGFGGEPIDEDAAGLRDTD
ncbi:MAG: hypothetical protein AAGU11_02100 [Syntrophobacteraceae bacterium]